MTTESSSKRWRPLLAGAAVIAVVAVGLSLPAGRSSWDGFSDRYACRRFRL